MSELDLTHRFLVQEKDENDKRIRFINYPFGDFAILLRAFWIVQCPFLNLW